jgi:hypothetical protein
LTVATDDGMPFCVVFRGRGSILGGGCGFTPGSIRPGTKSIALQDAMVGNVVPEGTTSASAFFDVSSSTLKAG